MRKQVLETYEDLAKRGEKVIQDLRTRPQTRLVFARAEKTLKHAEEKLQHAEEKVEHAEHRVTGPAAKGARKPAAHKAPASK